MQFYVADVHFPEAWDAPGYAAKSMERNEDGKGDVQFYLAAKYPENELARFVGIVRGTADAERAFAEHLKAIGLEGDRAPLKEISLGKLCFLLRLAERKGLIPDEDEILEQFHLRQIASGRGISFEERMMDTVTRKKCEKAARDLMMEQTMLPEMDRIWDEKPRKKLPGHPVHYVIYSDGKVRERAAGTLLRALYTNGRIHNRRVCLLDADPKDPPCSDGLDALYESCADGSVVVDFTRTAVGEEEDHVTGEQELIGMLCKRMMKYRSKVLTVFCLPPDCSRIRDAFFSHFGSTAVVEIREESARGARAEEYLRMLARDRKVRADKNLLSRVDPALCYTASDLERMADEWYEVKLRREVYPRYREIQSAAAETVRKKDRGSAYDELQSMIGLSEAKEVIDKALDYYKVQKLFRDRGLSGDRPSMHMVFTGNPGTAKTTVARLLARIMAENGLLTGGQMVEVGRGDLVGKYVGWTAKIIQEKFTKAAGGVLFIDEAYSLVDDRSGSYGDEAINTIVQEMENHRKDTVVIFAGYPEPMESFLDRNPGLRSRIAFHVPFADYTTGELCGIAELMCRRMDMRFSEDAGAKLAEAFDAARRQADFGNGRCVRNLLEQARMNQASRILRMDPQKVTDSVLRTLCAEDVCLPKSAGAPAVRIGFSA